VRDSYCVTANEYSYDYYEYMYVVALAGLETTQIMRTINNKKHH
jgi:hypothetical protein